MDELSYQIRRVAPSEGIGAVWQTPSSSNKGVPVWESACFSDIAAFIEALRGYPSALGVKNLYFTHATFKAPDSPTAQSAAARSPCSQHPRYAHASHRRRRQAGRFRYDRRVQADHLAMLAEIGLKPSFIVLTSAPLDPARLSRRRACTFT